MTDATFSKKKKKTACSKRKERKKMQLSYGWLHYMYVQRIAAWSLSLCCGTLEYRACTTREKGLL